MPIRRPRLASRWLAPWAQMWVLAALPAPVWADTFSGGQGEGSSPGASASPFAIPDLLNPTPPTPDDRPRSGPGFLEGPPSLAGLGRPVPVSGAGEPDPGLGWERPSQEPRKVHQERVGEWGTLTSQVVYQAGTDGWEDPLGKRTWKTEEAWKCPVAGPLFVFGQLGANSEEPVQQDLKVTGRTGLACKLAAGPNREVVVRSGPGVSYTDPFRPVRSREQTDWVVEVQARWPLLFGIGVEYQGTAAPALNPQDHDSINQDLRLALPVGDAGKVQVGARHRWQNVSDPRPLSDSMQLYLGLELAR